VQLSAIPSRATRCCVLNESRHSAPAPTPRLRLRRNNRNQTDRPEQLHRHGPSVSTDADGSGEEGTPFISPHGSRRISLVPSSSGYRFYHAHVRAKNDLSAGQYSGLVGQQYRHEHPDRGSRACCSPTAALRMMMLFVTSRRVCATRPTADNHTRWPALRSQPATLFWGRAGLLESNELP
jgi:hypothetical protein